VYMNSAAEHLAKEGDGLRLHTDQIAPTDPLTRIAFRTLILTAAAANGHDPGVAIALERRSGKRPLQVLITPFRTPNHHHSEARVLVLVTDPELKVNFPEAGLRALYDLT